MVVVEEFDIRDVVLRVFERIICVIWVFLVFEVSGDMDCCGVWLRSIKVGVCKGVECGNGVGNIKSFSYVGGWDF